MTDLTFPSNAIQELHNKYTWSSLSDLSIQDLIELAQNLDISINIEENKEGIIQKILQKTLRPELSVEVFRDQMMEYLPTKDVISLCLTQPNIETQPESCQNPQTWISLLRRDFNINNFQGNDPKKEYALQYGLSLIRQDPSSEESLWRLIEMVTRPYDFLSTSSDIRSKMWNDLYNLKQLLSPDVILTLNNSYTRLSNFLFILLSEHQSELGSLYKLPDIIYFTDYLISLGKLHFYLFRESPIRMILDSPLLYLESISPSSFHLLTFPNFFLHRPSPSFPPLSPSLSIISSPTISQISNSIITNQQNNIQSQNYKNNQNNTQQNNIQSENYRNNQNQDQHQNQNSTNLTYFLPNDKNIIMPNPNLKPFSSVGKSRQFRCKPKSKWRKQTEPSY